LHDRAAVRVEQALKQGKPHIGGVADILNSLP
jgi:hypothetical protein